MKTNARYTAKELIEAAGLDVSQVGKVRVRIAGIAGIVSPDHLVRLQPETKEVEVIVGTDTKMVQLEDGADEPEVSEEAKKALEAKGKELTEKAEKLAKEKKAAKEKAEEKAPEAEEPTPAE